MNPTTIKRNSDEYRKFEMVASMLEYESPSHQIYMVQDVYFDYGQDWMWTTITSLGGKWGGVQVLNPRQWEDIMFADSLEELVKVVRDIRSDKYFGDK